MSTAERAHGTRTKYVHDGCRCFACKVANANSETGRAERRRQRAPWRVRYVRVTGEYWVQNQLTLEAHGERWSGPAGQAAAYECRDALNRLWPEQEPAPPPLWADERKVREVRRHMDLLRSQGVSEKGLARNTRISRSRLMEIRTGRGMRPDRPVKRRLKLETAERILSVVAGFVAPAPGANVAAAETWRLIEEFLAAGYPRYRIARALAQAAGREAPDRPGLQVRPTLVLARTEDRVKRLHDALYRLSPRLRAACQCPEWRP